MMLLWSFYTRCEKNDKNLTLQHQLKHYGQMSEFFLPTSFSSTYITCMSVSQSTAQKKKHWTKKKKKSIIHSVKALTWTVSLKSKVWMKRQKLI